MCDLCDYCGGEIELRGYAGSLVYGRCHNCGAECSSPVGEVEGAYETFAGTLYDEVMGAETD